MNEPILIASQSLPDDIKVIIDIGAHIGQEIPYLKSRWSNARIIAIEPNPEPYQELIKHRGIETYQLAISDHEGVAPFYPSATFYDKPHSASSSLRRPKEHLEIFPGVSFGAPFLVSVLTLDAFCLEHGISGIDLLWMDVQGCEGDVIAGGPAMIPKTRFIYAESYPNELYEGQAKREDFLKSLPHHHLMFSDATDVLLRRNHA